jgi:hypothetical protein
MFEYIRKKTEVRKSPAIVELCKIDLEYSFGEDKEIDGLT